MAYNTANINGVISLNTSTAGTTSIGSNTAGAITITTGAGNFSLVGGGHTVGIANDAAINTLNLGSTTVGSITSIRAGTGGMSLLTGTTGNLSINTGTTGVLTLGTLQTGNVTIGNTSGTTSIQFGTGSALSTFTDWAAWTPTVDGSVSGTTTYVTQFGTFMRLGNFVIAAFKVAYSAATGTGTLIIGGLPIAISNTANYNPTGSLAITGSTTWPASTTNISLNGSLGTTQMTILASGSGAAFGNVQISNTAITIQGQLMYRV